MYQALIGSIQFHKGRTKEALVYFKKINKVEPNNSTVLYYIAFIYGISGHIDPSRNYFNKLCAVEPWSCVNPSWFDYYSGNFEKAIDLYQKALEIEDKLDEALFILGLTHLEKGDNNKALSTFALYKQKYYDSLPDDQKQKLDDLIRRCKEEKK